MGKVTIEISMYALRDEYKAAVDDFIFKLKANSSIQIEVHGLSTYIWGDMEVVWPWIADAMQTSWHNQPSVFVMKIAAGTLNREGLPDYLKQ